MRRLVEFPAAVADVLLGTTDPDQVPRRVREFAESYDDLKDVVDSVDMDRLIRVVLGAETLPMEREFLRDLGPLSFESLGASVGWRIDHGCDPPEAVFIWVSCLCYHPDPECGGGIGPAVVMLTVYVLSEPRENGVLRLLLEFCEAFVREHPWTVAPHVLPVFVAVALGLNQTDRLDAVIREKLGSDPLPEDHRVLRNWFDAGRGEVVDRMLAFVEEQFAAELPAEKLSRIRPHLTQVFRLIASDNEGQSEMASS